MIVPGIEYLQPVTWGRTGIPVIADLLGDPLAHPDGALLVDSGALLHQAFGALLLGLFGADLVGDLATRMAGHISALLLGHCLSNTVRHSGTYLVTHSWVSFSWYWVSHTWVYSVRHDTEWSWGWGAPDTKHNNSGARAAFKLISATL